MALTMKDPAVTLSRAEQIELRKFMKNPSALHPVSTENNPIRKILIDALEMKGYIRKEGGIKGYDFYILIEE